MSGACLCCRVNNGWKKINTGKRSQTVKNERNLLPFRTCTLWYCHLLWALFQLKIIVVSAIKTVWPEKSILFSGWRPPGCTQRAINQASTKTHFYVPLSWNFYMKISGLHWTSFSSLYCKFQEIWFNFGCFTGVLVSFFVDYPVLVF